ncbi:uncharacterized protein [Amphiura filiformis]|uniref:uncharacterized protein n=1 Tax=Amphiura filiformis TaxID=82378 RepID=UPI003B21F574
MECCECLLPNANICLSPLLTCRNTFGGYYCECINPGAGGACNAPGFSGFSGLYRGRFAIVEFQGVAVVFTPELLDPTSAAFVQWRTIIQDVLQDVFAGLGIVTVLSFYDGSIGVNFQVAVANTAVSPQQVSQRFYSQISGDYFVASSTLKLAPSSIYFEGDGYDYDGCPLGYCLNGGVCVASSTYGYSCLCAVGYSGQTCDVYDNPDRDDGTLSTGVIAAIAVAGLVAVLSLFLICLCCFFISRRLPSRGKNPDRTTEVGMFPQQMQMPNGVLDLANLQLNYEGSTTGNNNQFGNMMVY